MDKFMKNLIDKVKQMTPEEALNHHCEAHGKTVADVLMETSLKIKKLENQNAELVELVEEAYRHGFQDCYFNPKLSESKGWEEFSERLQENLNNIKG